MLRTVFAAAACVVLACSAVACGQAGSGPSDTAISSPAAESTDATVTTAKCTRRECARSEDRCVAGCDPPNEKGTVTGCSNCYSRRTVCVAWRTVPC